MLTQQTAVEFFADKIDSLIPYVNEKTADEFRKLLEEAKQMFEEQIIKAHREQSYLQDDGSWLELTGEQYYTQTYGNNTK